MDLYEHAMLISNVDLLYPTLNKTFHRRIETGGQKQLHIQLLRYHEQELDECT